MRRSERTPAIARFTLTALVAIVLSVLAPTAAHAALGSFSNVGQPTVTGTGEVGTDFTASMDTSGVTPIAPTSIDYVWYQADNGAVLQTGGTTFTATSDLVGKNVYVIATLGAQFYTSYVTLNSPFSATIHLGSFTAGASPVLSGQHNVGGTLTASIDTSGWTPIPTSVSWQWFLSDGTALPGETGSSIAATNALVGQSVYAVATLSAPDVQDFIIGSPLSGKIAAATVTTTDSSVSAGGKTTVEVWGLLFSTDYDLELHSTPVSLGTFRSAADGTLVASVTIPAGTAPGEHRIVILRSGVEVGSVAITVPGAPVAKTLAKTGGDNATLTPVATLGLGALAAGMIVLFVVRRSQRRSAAA